MAAPVIQSFQSILGAIQGRAYQFQPYASNSPSSWAVETGSALPPGLTLNLTTGRLKGPVTAAGVYNFGLIAHNADGYSDPLVFTMGVLAAPALLAADILEMDIDVPSRIATMRQDANLDAYKSVNTKRPFPIMFAKRGDVLLLRVRFYRGEDIINVPATLVAYGVKNLEPESLLVESSNWVKTVVPDTGDVFYTLRIPFDKPELAAALADEETDDATFFIGLGEVSWEFTNTTAPLIGDNKCRTTTQTFGVVTPRDLVEDTAP